MAEKKEVAVLKRAKISQAQQYVLLAVLGASLFLGVATALVLHFIDKISFNINVISEEERIIVEYSDAIKNIGICRAPAGSIYTDQELAACIPDDIDVSMVPGTLRANIMETMAANKALNSVPKEDNTNNCVNPLTEKTYTYEEMQKLYDKAETTEDRVAASQLIKSCSALRVIPDALPSLRNEEALLASLNKIFLISGWLPKSISPGSGDYGGGSEYIEGIDTIYAALGIEADSAVTMRTLSNIERSIREFNFINASIEWSEGALKFNSVATAYYTGASTISEKSITIKATDSASKDGGTLDAEGVSE